jgi:hypothetical protein
MPAPALLLAANVGFAVVFGIFVVAVVVLAVITITWALRRDRAGRAAWRRRPQARTLPGPDPATNGHRPTAPDRPPTDPAS